MTLASLFVTDRVKKTAFSAFNGSLSTYVSGGTSSFASTSHFSSEFILPTTFPVSALLSVGTESLVTDSFPLLIVVPAIVTPRVPQPIPPLRTYVLFFAVVVYKLVVSAVSWIQLAAGASRNTSAGAEAVLVLGCGPKWSLVCSAGLFAGRTQRGCVWLVHQGVHDGNGKWQGVSGREGERYGGGAR